MTTKGRDDVASVIDSTLAGGPRVLHIALERLHRAASPRPGARPRGRVPALAARAADEQWGPDVDLADARRRLGQPFLVAPVDVVVVEGVLDESPAADAFFRTLGSGALVPGRPRRRLRRARPAGRSQSAGFTLGVEAATEDGPPRHGGPLPLLHHRPAAVARGRRGERGRGPPPRPRARAHPRAARPASAPPSPARCSLARTSCSPWTARSPSSRTGSSGCATRTSCSGPASPRCRASATSPRPAPRSSRAGALPDPRLARRPHGGLHRRAGPRAGGPRDGSGRPSDEQSASTAGARLPPARRRRARDRRRRPRTVLRALGGPAQRPSRPGRRGRPRARARRARLRRAPGARGTAGTSVARPTSGSRPPPRRTRPGAGRRLEGRVGPRRIEAWAGPGPPVAFDQRPGRLRGRPQRLLRRRPPPVDSRCCATPPTSSSSRPASRPARGGRQPRRVRRTRARPSSR